MHKLTEKIITALGWTYALCIVVWFVLHTWLRDAVWWFSVLENFTPFLFIPLVILIPLGVLIRKRFYLFGLIPPTLLFLWLYGTLFLPGLAQAASGETLSVMTFNVWGFSEKPDTAQAILQDGSPDIVALQEISADFADILINELGKVYPYHLMKLHDRPDSGLMILSRYPITQLTSAHISDWRVLVGRVTIDDRSLILYNIHPTVSNMLIYIEDAQALAENVSRSTQIRESEIREVVADIETRSEPIVVAGDANTTDQSTAYRILAQYLTDAHRAVGWGFGHTFPAYAGSWRGMPIIARQLRIDMIWYSDAFSALSCKVGTQYGESDHRPVIAELHWAD